MSSIGDPPPAAVGAGAAAPVAVPPKRGGIHPTYRKFIGGAKIDDNYRIVKGDNNLYRFSTQRRHEKTITSIERALREARDNVTTIKFNGTLEPPQLGTQTKSARSDSLRC